MSDRNKQINKEALITLALYAFYFCWWYYFAYLYEAKIDGHYKFIFGLPSWFFYSCILGLFIINILVFIIVKLFFKDMDLE